MKRLITGLSLISALSGCESESVQNLERFVEAVPRMQKEYGCIGGGCFSNAPFESNSKVNLYVQDKASADFLKRCTKKSLTEEQTNTSGLASDIASDEGAKTLVFDSSTLGFVAAITYNHLTKNKQGDK